MHAIYAAGIDRENPLSVLEIGNLENGQGILAVDSRGINRVHGETLAELRLVHMRAAI